MNSLAIFTICCLISCVTSGPITKEASQKYDNAEELGDKFEGDMDLTPDQLQLIVHPRQRNGLIAAVNRWKNNTVDYIISANYSEEHVAYIRKALDTLQLVTCINFVYHTDSNNLTDYVDIVNDGEGCFSKVGRMGGRQTLNLETYNFEIGCFRLATIMHEFIHALGFYHMQSSYDRDDYVKINWENIKPNKESNFIKYDAQTVTDFGVKYDYGSVMHYSSLAFSKNGLPTIETIDQKAEIGQRIGLSKSDIEKINHMYKCSK